MARRLLTVIIPTYNRAGFLRESIPSVLNQTFRDFELLVSDNASSDDTAEVVTSFRDPRIRYHRQPRNLGMMGNWRSAIGMADSEWVAPLSDDDLYQPDHLDSAFAALAQHPEAAYFTCPAARFGGDATGELRPDAITDRSTPVLYFPPESAVRFMGLDNPGPMMTMVCRKSAIDESVYWGRPDYILIDLLVMPQLMARGGFVFGNRPTVRYRHHASNASYQPDRRYLMKINCQIWYSVRWVAQFLVDRGINSLADIEAHGVNAPLTQHVVPVVMGLASFRASRPLREVGRRIWQARRDMDAVSARFRLARRVGFTALPLSERVTQLVAGWQG